MAQALQIANVERIHYQNIIDYTSAVLFLGTPHGGSDYAAFAKPFADIAQIALPRALGSVRKDLITSLERNGPELLGLSRQFRHIIDKENIRIYSFVELDRHPLLSARVCPIG